MQFIPNYSNLNSPVAGKTSPRPLLEMFLSLNCHERIFRRASHHLSENSVFLPSRPSRRQDIQIRPSEGDSMFFYIICHTKRTIFTRRRILWICCRLICRPVRVQRVSKCISGLIKFDGLMCGGKLRYYQPIINIDDDFTFSLVFSVVSPFCVRFVKPREIESSRLSPKTNIYTSKIDQRFPNIGEISFPSDFPTKATEMNLSVCQNSKVMYCLIYDILVWISQNSECCKSSRVTKLCRWNGVENIVSEIMCFSMNRSRMLEQI